MTRIAARKELVSTAPPKVLDRLKATTAKFRTALAAHERALFAVKEVTEGIVRTIANGVAAANAGPRSYSAGGAYAAAHPSTAAALTLNKTA